MATLSLPLLKLVIEKGPRSGETLEFLPTQPPIGIGRVVRGNSLPIKDPGISTKHLTIEFKSNKWLITDNDSSNGTVLNNSQLPPLSPTALGDGDFVKIGEVTVIRVEIVKLGNLGAELGKDAELGFGGELGKKTRGRPKKEKVEILTENVGPVSTRTQSSKKEINSLNVVEEIKIGEYTEVGCDGELGKKARGRPKKEKVETLPGNAGLVSTRRTRSSKNGINILNVVEEIGKREDGELGLGGDLGKKVGGRQKKEKAHILLENVGTRRTRSSKNEVSNLSVVEETRNEELDIEAEVFEKKTQRGRGRRGKEKALEGVDLGKKNEELGPIKVEQISTRRTRSVRVNVNVEREDMAALVVGMKMTEKGKMSNNNDNEQLNSTEGNCSGNGNVINVQSGDGLNSEKVVVKTEPRDSVCEVEKVVGTDKGEGEKESDCTGSDLEKEECVKESGFHSEKALDLEKMTLGEWFDYLDVHLPKTIYEETEQIIMEMHQKAEKFREFVHEHEKKKGEGSLHAEHS